MIGSVLVVADAVAAQGVTADMVSDAARVCAYVCARNPAPDRGAGALQCG